MDFKHDMRSFSHRLREIVRGPAENSIFTAFHIQHQHVDGVELLLRTVYVDRGSGDHLAAIRGRRLFGTAELGIADQTEAGIIGVPQSDAIEHHVARETITLRVALQQRQLFPVRLEAVAYTTSPRKTLRDQ